MQDEQEIHKINTKQLASLFAVEATSIRTTLSTKGHFWGMKPLKAPNGRLVWDRREAEALLHKAA